MKPKFDPATLFESWKRDVSQDPYPTYAANLDAVHAGKKGMSMYGFLASDLTSGDGDFVELRRLASERGLVLVLHSDPLPGLAQERQSTTIFVARPDNLWRVPAYLALWKTAIVDGPWTNNAEAQMSLLLGYSDRQIRAWLASLRYQRAAWGCATIYTLLNREQIRLVRSLGKRCFGPAGSMEGMRFHWPTGTLKRGAFRLLPESTALARVGLEWDRFRALFGRPPRAKRGLATATIEQASSAATTTAFTTSVQFLTASGWK